MDQNMLFYSLAAIFGFYMAWNIGANDVANAMGTSVGSGALSLKRAVIIAAIMEFLGAVLVGQHVSQTIRKGIIDPELFAKFHQEDIKDYAKLASFMKSPDIPLRKHIAAKLTSERKAILQSYEEGKPSDILKINLLDEMNSLLTVKTLYDEKEFEKFNLGNKFLKKLERPLTELKESAKKKELKEIDYTFVNLVILQEAYQEALIENSRGRTILIYGMLGALLAAGSWLLISSYNGWPVSTTHSIVGSIIGFGLIVGGFHSIHWDKVASIASSWVISPLLSGIISFIIFSIIRKTIFFSQRPAERAKKLAPVFVFFVLFVMTLVMLFKGLKHLKLDLGIYQAIFTATMIGGAATLCSIPLIRRIKTDSIRKDEAPNPEIVVELNKACKDLKSAKKLAKGGLQYQITRIYDEVKNLIHTTEDEEGTVERHSEFQVVERIFVYLQILSACFVAFAHGANDVANAIGPLSAVISVIGDGAIALKANVSLWVLCLGGVGIVVGLATWGWRVILTIGSKITELTPSRGFAAEFGAAITIVVASKLGLPISTTHTLVGAVLGVGLARGFGALNLGTLKVIIVSWVVTIPAGAGLTILFYYFFVAIFG